MGGTWHGLQTRRQAFPTPNVAQTAAFMFNPSAPHCTEVAQGIEQHVQDDMTTGEGSKTESEPSIVQKAWEGESAEAEKDELTTNDFSAAATQLQVRVGGGYRSFQNILYAHVPASRDILQGEARHHFPKPYPIPR